MQENQKKWNDFHAWTPDKTTGIQVFMQTNLHTCLSYKPNSKITKENLTANFLVNTQKITQPALLLIYIVVLSPAHPHKPL